MEALLRTTFPQMTEPVPVGDLENAFLGDIVRAWDEIERADKELLDWRCDHREALENRYGSGCRYPRLAVYARRDERAYPRVEIERGPCPEIQPVLQQRHLHHRMVSAGVPERFADADLDDFKADTTARKRGLAAARAWVKGFPGDADPKGLVLVGPVGRGKSFLAAACVRALLSAGKVEPPDPFFRGEFLGESQVERREAAAWITVPAALEHRRREFSADRQGDASKAWDRAEGAQVAVLDDLGAEKLSPWAVEQVFILVNARYEAALPIITTTNANPAELADRLGERAASRLAEMTRGYMLDGPDRRTSRTPKSAADGDQA